MRIIVQVFLAGFCLPAVAFIALATILVPQGTFYFFRYYPFYYLPLIWGVWNLLYYYLARHVIFLKKLGVWGALLGAGVSSVGVFYFNTLTLYQKVYAGLNLYNVIAFEVVVYFIVFETLVRFLNNILID